MRDIVAAVHDATIGEGGAPDVGPVVHRLRAAYAMGELVVMADAEALRLARRAGAHAIDTRDVADAMLRWGVTGRAGPRRPR